MAKTERIYLGGLDPPRLTAQHVVSRLKDMAVTIQNVEDHPEKSFCHLTAICTESENEKTALEIISSKYHNVKWKGCRLQVQAARPHFLERLEEERLQRKEELELQQLQKQVEELGVGEGTNPELPKQEEVDPTQTEHVSFIPRRLRIRRKFGDEAVHVDTKPWSVETWSNFSRATGKQRKRVLKRLENRIASRKDPSITPAPLMHRAVHIRFPEDPDQALTSEGTEETPRKMKREAKYDDSSSLESEDDDSQNSGSEGDTEEDQEDKEEHATGTNYSWSDDGENSESSEEEAIQARETESWNYPAATEDFDKESESNLDTSKDEMEDEPVATLTESKDTTASKSYQWSSSEDESSEDDFEYIRKLRMDRPFRQVSETDDFAAGLDLGADDDAEDDDVGDDESVVPMKDENEMDCDITNDVSSNLNILSSIFSEVSSATPAEIREDPADDVSEERDEEKKQTASKTGFAASGIMLRFDPSAASSQQFEIKNPEASTNSGDAANSDGSQNEESSEQDDREAEDKPDPQAQGMGTETKESTVYEQDKLEDVFREARQGWAASPAVTSTAVPSTTAGGFSFGFDLGTDTTQEVEVEEDKGTDETDALINDQGDVSEDKHTLPVESEVEERRLAGFKFPFSAVEKYKKQFFDANDGMKITQDVEAFRHDPDEKEAWKKERFNLTLDWKRKKKHAQSRIQKRMKIR